MAYYTAGVLLYENWYLYTLKGYACAYTNTASTKFFSFVTDAASFIYQTQAKDQISLTLSHFYKTQYH